MVSTRMPSLSPVPAASSAVRAGSNGCNDTAPQDAIRPLGAPLVCWHRKQRRLAERFRQSADLVMGIVLVHGNGFEVLVDVNRGAVGGVEKRSGFQDASAARALGHLTLASGEAGILFGGRAGIIAIICTPDTNIVPELHSRDTIRSLFAHGHLRRGGDLELARHAPERRRWPSTARA